MLTYQEVVSFSNELQFRAYQIKTIDISKFQDI